MALFRKLENHQEKLLGQFRLQVKTELEALTEVLNWFEQVTQSFLLPKCRWQCKLALAEGFTNAVRHAHHNLSLTTPINLEVNRFPHYLEIRIYDWGQPFDLLAKLRSLREGESNYLEREGARGLLFMQELTDDIQYQRLSQGGNCLILRKQIL